MLYSHYKLLEADMCLPSQSAYLIWSLSEQLQLHDKLKNYQQDGDWNLMVSFQSDPVSLHRFYWGVTYAEVIPPSTSKLAPVIYELSGDARKSAAFAISSASPKRPMGMWTRRLCFFSSVSKNFIRSSVLSGPGHRELTRTPSLAWMTASSLVRARTAPLLAVYAIWGVAAPRNATNEAVLITEPPPDLIIAGMPYLKHQ